MSVQSLLGIVGALLAILLAVIGFFGKRLLGQVDTALEAASQRDQEHAEQMSSLTETLKNTVEKLNKTESTLASLLTAFHAFDRWIYGEAQHGAFKNPPPQFPPKP